MARDELNPEASVKPVESDKQPACGIIMPISATDNFSEKHWSNVQSLLHRAIRQADFIPVNVWAGEVIDRISERIIGNIFSHDIVVVDTSDLNPNVMLELGLRLASKKTYGSISRKGRYYPVRH
ncbi:hypothetical protein [Brevundimonas bullata]|uniref:hypothetical protein n=1 Tax=Brevundimonas bullata TaxID=13160 RepID=UPI002FD89C91